jgi:hypothetical protein
VAQAALSGDYNKGKIIWPLGAPGEFVADGSPVAPHAFECLLRGLDHHRAQGVLEEHSREAINGSRMPSRRTQTTRQLITG